jgi:hypothetical protein
LSGELDEELSRCRQVFDDDAHMFYPFEHGGSPSELRGPWWPLMSLGRSQRHILDIRKRAEVQNLLLAVTAVERTHRRRRTRFWVAKTNQFSFGSDAGAGCQ